MKRVNAMNRGCTVRERKKERKGREEEEIEKTDRRMEKKEQNGRGRRR